MLPAGTWLVPAQAGLALAVVASWLWLLTYRREFQAAAALPSLILSYKMSHADALETRPATVAGSIASPGLEGRQARR